jgi:uncharacterized damage-inducible protein DinB
MPIPEVWLRGPLPGIPALLQPAAHALVQVREDIEQAIAALNDDQLWARPGGVAAIGYHLAHVPGSLDRLLTYARGDALSPAQRAALGAEQTVHEDRPARSLLRSGLVSGIDAALAYLEHVDEHHLLDARTVGRLQLPSTTLGLIFHAAEHSSRHAGQVVTLARIVSAT